MVRDIIKLPFMLMREGDDATPQDVPIAQDLLDTLAFHASDCVGMAANMIGQNKRIIVFNDGTRNREMFNPQVVKGFQPYDTKEGCLSLAGMRPAKRYKRIVVRYQDRAFAWHEETFVDFTAQIIQHEVDHTNGVLI